MIVDEKLYRVSESDSEMELVLPFDSVEAKILNLVQSPDGKFVAFERYGEAIPDGLQGDNLRFLGKAYRPAGLQTVGIK